MALDQLPWAIGLFLVALAIAALNDMTKPKETRKKPEKQAGGSVLGLLIGVAVTASVITLAFTCRRDVSGLTWLVPLVFVSVVLFVPAFLLRKVIWLYLKSAVTGRPSLVIWRNADGELETKCPCCSARVSVTEGQRGEAAFECPDCGEKATWDSQLKP